MMRRIVKILLCLAVILYGIETIPITTIDLTGRGREQIEQGKIIVEEVPSKNKKGKTFEAIGLIKAPINEVYQVVTTFEDYSKFMPNLRKLDILQRDDSSAVLNYTLSLPFRMVKQYRVSVSYTNNESAATVAWEMIQWPGLKKNKTIRDTNGYWLLKNYSER